MDESKQYIVFTLDEQRYALHLSSVKRIIRAVDITPLPKAPEIVLGVINVQGEIVPIINVRKRFRLPEREMELSDHLMVASTSRHTVALLVDAVEGVIELSNQEMIPPSWLSTITFQY